MGFLFLYVWDYACTSMDKIVEHYMSCPLRWNPEFQLDLDCTTRWRIQDFIKGGLALAHT